MCSLPDLVGGGEKFPQRQAWILERRCLLPRAQNRRLLCGFADFLHFSSSSSSFGPGGDFWARGCSQRSPGFSTSYLFAVSKEAWSGKAHQRVSSDKPSHQLLHRKLFLQWNRSSGCPSGFTHFICWFDEALPVITLYLLPLWKRKRVRATFSQVVPFRQFLRPSTRGCAKQLISRILVTSREKNKRNVLIYKKKKNRTRVIKFAFHVKHIKPFKSIKPLLVEPLLRLQFRISFTLSLH